MSGEDATVDWQKVREWSWRTLVIGAAAANLVVVLTRWNRWQGGAGWQSTDDAYLQADITPIAAKVAGYVRDVPVQDYERVHAGQVLARLVDDDYRAAVAQSDALKAQREFQLSNIQAARAVVVATTATIEQNARDLARQRRLLESGSSSAEATERLTTLHAQLEAQLEQNRAQAESATRQLGVLTAQEAQSEAAIAAQRANLQVAALNLGYTTIVAARDGVRGQRQVKPGQYVGVGSQITTLTPLPHVWVTANYKETQLTHMAVGQKAEIEVDVFPGHTLRGHLLAFSPGSGSQFALLPPDNATGNFTKVVQRVAVKIAIDDADGLADRLLPGMSVEARIAARGR